ncbi:MAG: SIR2 family protein [Acidobacteriota bacterium]
MSHKNSVQAIASLLRATNEARPVFLLGAGASFSSGVPLAAESVRRIARRVFAEKIKGGSVLPERVKPTEWQTWLQSHPWFIKGEDRLAENFPLVVQHLLDPREYRSRVLRDLLRPTSEIGTGYKRLAEFVMRKLVCTILTTNFDTCLPTALNERRAHIQYLAEVNRGPDDLREFSIFNRAQLVWLHGRAEQYTDLNRLDEVDKLDPKLVKLLVPLLTDSPLIVVGYRGSEPSIMDHLLTKNARYTHNYRNGVYWCIRQGETLHTNVESLRRAIKGNFKLLEIIGFDELMEDLARELQGEDLYLVAPSPEAPHRSLPFDDTPINGATTDELDQDLMISVMREYCAKLGRAPVTLETLPALLREQGLLVDSRGTAVPTAGCLLLFGKNPQSRFPHAVVSATIGGKKRSVFVGNLIRQRREILDWLESSDVNPVLRVKKRATHEDSLAYPPRALVELLINMLVHRDYEVSELAAINVAPGMSITFTNPGGLLDSVARRVTLDEEGRFRPIPNISDLRNRSLCDVFFGIQAMEREGTGLSDVEAMAREIGGTATFAHDGKLGKFAAHIFQPIASAGSKTIARDERPTGVYMLNVLPFVSLPEHISIARLSVTLRDRPAGLSLDEVGTFIRHGDDIWSFVPLTNLTQFLEPILDVTKSTSRERSELESIPDSRRILSWLLRKHLERFLRGFKNRGLILEEDKHRRRAYFEGREGKPRTLVYDSPRRKGIQRQVVKQRADGVSAWFENEGFGYEVTQLDGLWALRIKPFYMFTGRDACTPLPTFTRTARATRRIKFDRNKSVEDDLTFWSRFLSKGGPTINIGQDHVDDLIVSGSFYTVEVAEEGLTEDQNANPDRLSA